MSILVEVIKACISQRQAGAVAGRMDGSQKLGLAMQSLEAGNLAEAEALCLSLPEGDRLQPQAAELLGKINHARMIRIVRDFFPGPTYLDWLQWFHQAISPRLYLEIGVESGQSLKFSAPPTRAIGVDPVLRVAYTQTSWVRLFGMTSDQFFGQEDIQQIFEGGKIDLAFIDGLHTFDQALQDFINIEQHASRGTVVLFHDIYPVIPESAARERETLFWLGDTWKAMLILKKYRPDLRLFVIPAYPSGLGVVTKLDPDSSLLANNFHIIVDEWMPANLAGKLEEKLHIVGNDQDSVKKALA